MLNEFPTIQVESIHFHRDDVEGTDGYVYYLVLYPCTHEPCTHICATHLRRTHHYERQAFRRGAFGHRLNGTPKEIENNQANVWGWDGNVDAPTLTPSFLGDRSECGFRIHLHLNGGRIDLCGDSTVRLHPSPAPCVDKDDL